MSQYRSIGGILRSSLIVNEKKKHSASVIFAHGIGERGQLWADIIETIQSKGNQHIKFICPNSLVEPVSKYYDYPIRSWFNYSRLGQEDRKSLDFSAAAILSIIDNEVQNNNIHPERIIVGGFGQGGALALYSFFNGGYSLGGCFTLSGYLPLNHSFKNVILDSVNIKNPLLMLHGDQDELIDLSIGQQSFDFLKNKGCTNSEFIIYKDLGDGVCPKEIDDISIFLNNKLPNLNKIPKFENVNK
ncbi:hypothetical protein DICPUDRAFT_43087 [Dictyostelium purpureum]|uniref:Phospholipase/carboxylesterase/thioesterase domain-containing protein n=1 Tax=Dictyostelium purpureum TaxID=5786 RepID=F1A3G2_DICPU|nr:uncharacterized protein DICPUDRAFT_43087 [Dictyostelium purpureum]EGC29270.1 hypothetical protein DICPUDRAFT_43087 [Dictyostelium purpureum]|eukprot:XP_003294207.1 hypothetical protein DICPUDRAFT_43087 [Dictyostelium purpureum]